jgi:hypothetical protein
MCHSDQAWPCGVLAAECVKAPDTRPHLALHASQVLLSGKIDEFAVLAMLLAAINAIPPLLFIVYVCTKGRVLHAAVWLAQLCNAALFAGVSGPRTSRAFARRGMYA